MRQLLFRLCLIGGVAFSPLTGLAGEESAAAVAVPSEVPESSAPVAEPPVTPVAEASLAVVAPPERPVAADPGIDLMAEAVKVSGFLLVFLVLALGATRLAKRWQPQSGLNATVEVLGGRNLGAGVGVRVVRVGSRAWLVGVTRERVSLLAEVTGEIPPAQSSPSGLQAG
ncbi:MAG: flagellar biosynthetic protein FliO [Magnetococcales bacterium]|nr:flagellar biosynthetic protein FliO [Magnetococcales bacterium]